MRRTLIIPLLFFFVAACSSDSSEEVSPEPEPITVGSTEAPTPAINPKIPSTFHEATWNGETIIVPSGGCTGDQFTVGFVSGVGDIFVSGFDDDLIDEDSEWILVVNGDFRDPFVGQATYTESFTGQANTLVHIGEEVNPALGPRHVASCFMVHKG